MKNSPHGWSRREFLAGGLAWCGAAGWLRADPKEKFRGRTVSLLHTTDLHGHLLPTVTYEGMGDVGGMARCVTQIRRWRAEAPDSLVVDVGDVYQGTWESWNQKGRLMIELFNRVGYDAWALGNHDFDWGREAVDAALAHSVPPVLAANLEVEGRRVGEAAGAWAKAKPWVVREIGGFRIGLVGLITPGLPFWLSPRTLGGVKALDPVAELARAVREVRGEKVDAVVVIGHMGWRPQDDYANPVRALLESVEGVDVYLGGHSHQDQPSWQVGRVLCSQASYHGIHCGRVDLTFDPDSRRLVQKRAYTVLMDHRVPPDPAVMELAEPEVKKGEEQLKRVVGHLEKPLNTRGRGNELSQLFARAFAAALKKRGKEVDGVFHGTFGTEGVTAGDVTMRDCWDWIPYENELVVGELGVEDLIAIDREERKSTRSDRAFWPFEISPSGEAVRFRGEPVAAGRRFRVAFNSYDAQSGGQSLMELSRRLDHPSAKREDTDVPTREALVDYLLENHPVPH